MHPEIEPENWTDLLQAITFMADPEADQDDPLAWANACSGTIRNIRILPHERM